METTITINGWDFKKAAPNTKCDWGLRSGPGAYDSLVLCNKKAVAVGPRPPIPLCEEHARGLADRFRENE